MSEKPEKDLSIESVAAFMKKGEIKETPLSRAQRIYNEKVGIQCTTVGLIMSDKELEKAYLGAAKRGVSLDAYLMVGGIGPDDEI